jgi:hypothetical protein
MSWNEVPNGWREVSEKEFAQSPAFIYPPVSSEHRQIHPEGEPEYLSVRLNFLHDGTGWALGHDYWKGRVRFFQFGCVHEWREVPSQECRSRGIFHGGRCFHVSECLKCHHVQGVDSSD